MIVPNLCCSIRVEPGNMHCVSVVVPHPSYLPEKSWTRVDGPDGILVVDCHTVELMKKYGYSVRRRGDVIMSLEIGCEEEDLRSHLSVSEDVSEDVSESLDHLQLKE